MYRYNNRRDIEFLKWNNEINLRVKDIYILKII